MKQQLNFKGMKSMPTVNVQPSGMHPETTALIKQIQQCKDPILSCTGFTSPNNAKRRLDALRRARANGLVKFKQAHRTGQTLYFVLK